MFKFNNGDRVRDLVSGFTGIITSRSDFINGCTRYGVAAEKLKDGMPADLAWFDEQQLELKKAGAVQIVRRSTGGPRPDVKRAADVRR